MHTVSQTTLAFQREINRTLICPTCGYCRIRHEGACPSCAANDRLAEAVAALRAEDDYDAINAAADAIRSVLIDAPVWRHRSPWERGPVAVRVVRDPVFPGKDGDDD